MSSGRAEEVLSEVYSPSGMGCSPQAGTRQVPAWIREKLKIRTEHLIESITERGTSKLSQVKAH